ncbi:galactoside alpha-(1,2)-fucosyltransferase 2-like [Liolophura sinensis]|uniref:galactoside alpha-(1,2)-fucosyltransferase 2-like n=1 Tax=Liolophura sinensis TaxID=3198878 RepID=UPI00315854F1
MMFLCHRRKLLGLTGFSLACTLLLCKLYLNNMKVRPVPSSSEGSSSLELESRRKIPNVTRLNEVFVNATSVQIEGNVASNLSTDSDENLQVYGLQNKFDVTPVNYKDAIFVTISGGRAGRLGNRMFQYAALIGLTKEASKTQPGIFPVVEEDSHLNTLYGAFHLGGAKSGPIKLKHPVMLLEDKPMTYCSRLLKEFLPGFNYTIMTYLQSWRYFANFSRTIRNEFKFKDSILEEAKAFLRKAVNGSTENVTLIGVHVRRGDMTLSTSRKRGYTPANATYLHRAFKYYRSKYSNVLFIVCSDDFGWSQTHIKGKDVRFSVKLNPEVDLAILSLCNHTIITSGSFGWWGAWLAGGDVVYYRNFPAPGSWLDSTCVRPDYFPKSWIGLA